MICSFAKKMQYNYVQFSLEMGCKHHTDIIGAQCDMANKQTAASTVHNQQDKITIKSRPLLPELHTPALTFIVANIFVILHMK